MSWKLRAGIALLLGAAMCRLHAQTATATLVGTVSDPTGSVVTGASLEIRNSATNQIRKVQSDQKGEFTAPNLAPGVYDVTVSKEGFRTLRQTNLVLQLNQEARMEFKLELGAVSQTVEIAASAPVLNTENGEKGDVVVADEMVEMPLNGRDFSNLALLIPGTLPNAQGGEGQSGMVVNGARADNTNFIIDGFTNRNPRDSSAVMHPNLDAMQEFKMQTTGYPAEYGRMAGGVVNVALKTGGNQLHGAVFEFLRNDVIDARNFFDTRKAPLRRNQFGGTVSGPVEIPKIYNGKDRTFFLFSWESYRQRQDQSAVGVVPTTAQRQGDFSGLPPIKDPLAASAAFFPGNQIPLSRISPIALAAQAYYPMPNRAGPNDYTVEAASAGDWDSDIVKIDHRFSQADTLSYRWLKRYDRSTAPFNSGNTGLFAQIGGVHHTLTGATYTRVFSPALINEARFGYTRTTEDYVGSHQGIDYNKKFGIAGDPVNNSLLGFPLFVISGYEKLGDNPSPVYDTVNNYSVSDTVTWVKASNLIKFGGDLLRVQFFQPNTVNVAGTYNFTGNWTNQPYGDYLLGLPNSTSRLFQLNTSYLLTTNYSLFIQNDWKVSSRLTLNLGLRYELPRPLHDKYGRWANFVPELGKLVIGSDALVPAGVVFTDPTKVATAKQAGLPSSLVYPDYKDFAPRFGFAWRPFGGNRTVLRGGYGIFYGSLEQDVQIRNALGNVFPFAITETINFNASNPNFLTIANPFPVAPNLANNLTTAAGYQLHAPTPYVQSWNMTVERDLGHDSAIEIGYIGSKGTHLGRGYNLNQPFRSAATAPNFPSPYPAWSTLTYYGFYMNSIYNAGSVTLRRRFSQNFFYRVSYIYAKSIDDGSQLNGGPTGGYGGVQDARDFRAERGRSDFDIGHSFTTSFSWVVPWRRNVLARGWQLAGTGIAHKGPPFTPQLSNVNLNLGQANRPNRIAKGTVANPSADQWYDVSAFPAVANGSFAFGNSGRGILDGPGTIGINLALSKNFAVRENSHLQFRWEMFNALNHANFTLPVANVNAPNAATITTAGDPRQMQVGLRYSF